MARPITAAERQEFSRDLMLAASWSSNRHAGVHEPAGERNFASYVGQLDIAETKLLAVECLRRLMSKRSRDHKLSVGAWIAQAARTLAVEDFGTVRDHLPNFEKTLATAERLRKGKRR